MSSHRKELAERDEVEQEIQVRGRELLAKVHSERLVALTPTWWQDRLMAWATSDPEFRVKLLRFVDVLPSLHSASAVADHVRQYFRDDAPLIVRAGSTAAAALPFRPILSRVVREGVFTMADRFIGGSNPANARDHLQKLVEDGTAYTVDLLGEAVLSDAEADTYLDRYLGLIATLTSDGDTRDDPVRRPNISVKLTALAPHFEPAAPVATWAAVRGRLERLLTVARDSGVFVNIDMEQYRFKDLTHFIFAEAACDPAFRDWDGLGIVVQAYTTDALADIARLETFATDRGTPITVRLVKGAYWDEETILAQQEDRPSPLFTKKESTDANYEACTDALLAAYPRLRPAFGTHNPRTITQALVKTQRARLPDQDVEFQMLYGMAEGLRNAVHDSGYRTRVYVPVGEILPGMAYLVRRLLENTSNESWLVHRHEEGNPEDLLKAPYMRPEDDEQSEKDERFHNASPAEFYRPEVRVAMETALAQRQRDFGKTYPLRIAGRDIRLKEQESVRCPAEPDVIIGNVVQAGIEQADRAVAVAAGTFQSWCYTPAAERAAILRKAAGLLEDRRFDFAATMIYESGKPWREADGDVIEAIDYLRYYAAQAEHLGAPVDMSVPGETNRYIHVGRGVAAVISPWNFPLAIVSGMTTAALAAGCTVILKPAEQSPIVATEFVELLEEAGIPPGVVNYLPGPGEVVGAHLVAHPSVDVIAFTGSNAVGLGIVEAAANTGKEQRNVKHVIAEMGGKNAIIVDEDADLDEAVADVLASAFGYAGQKCSACSRVIVVGAAYGPFATRLAAAVKSLPAGPPEDPSTTIPPVISAEARNRIEEYIAIGKREGRMVAQGAVPPGSGVAPVVFEDVPLDSRLSREEIFGPVLCMYHVNDFIEALAVASDSKYGLTGGLFSRNPRHIREASRQFDVGNFYINRTITGAVVGRQPFGGFAMSGLGDKAGGPDYLRQFMVPRVITENTMRRGFAGT